MISSDFLSHGKSNETGLDAGSEMFGPADNSTGPERNGRVSSEICFFWPKSKTSPQEQQHSHAAQERKTEVTDPSPLGFFRRGNRCSTGGMPSCL